MSFTAEVPRLISKVILSTLSVVTENDVFFNPGVCMLLWLWREASGGIQILSHNWLKRICWVLRWCRNILLCSQEEPSQNWCYSVDVRPTLSWFEVISQLWCVKNYRFILIVLIVLNIAFSALTLLVGRRKGIRPVKNWPVGCWHGYLFGARCRLAYGPADAITTHCLFLQ